MILLNDILQLPNPKEVKLRFNLNFGNKRPAIDYFTDQTTASKKKMLDGQYWNYGKKGNFSVGNISIGFVPIPGKTDCWLLFHVGKVTKDLKVRNGVGYEFVDLTNYDMFVGRIVIRFKNQSQNLIRRGDTTLQLCEIEEILPNVYNNDFFPGYANVNFSWRSLQILITKSSWRSALGNQKGVYLLVDCKTGKQYVGSAYGHDMLLGRWETYINTCHGGNKKMKRLPIDYIKDNFYFSILETFNQNVDDQIIIDRESYWKEVLRTRQFGYNDN
jgi:hypothetical protein